MTLIVDQLEELFTTAHDERVRATFLDALARTATDPDGRATVVVAFRGDSLDRFTAFAPFARLIGESQLLVGPMSDAQVHTAIEEPAHRAGLTLEAGLADAIAADVAGQPGALPLLSTALLQTWVRRRGPMLTHAGYHEAGGVAGAVARLAEDTYAEFTPHEKVVCRRLLMRLTEPGTGRDDVRRRVPLAELAATSEVSEARARDADRATPRHRGRRHRRGRARGVAARVATTARLAGGGPRGSPDPPPGRGRGDRVGRRRTRRHRAVPGHASRRRARLVCRAPG